MLVSTQEEPQNPDLQIQMEEQLRDPRPERADYLQRPEPETIQASSNKGSFEAPRYRSEFSCLTQKRKQETCSSPSDH